MRTFLRFAGIACLIYGTKSPTPHVWDWKSFLLYMGIILYANGCSCLGKHKETK